MTRRWTPRRFVTLRRVRVMACVASLTLTSALAFGVGARKSVALTVNGETTTVTTYAMSVDRLLQEQGVKVKTHDLVESTSPTSMLKNHDVVNVQSAYQTTITIDGQEVPFWTVASSAEQLLDFFNQNETEAAKITVNISNVYNKLTGGLIINQKGPVTVIADGKSSVAPNGKLPAAPFLTPKASRWQGGSRQLEKDGKKTILRVRRVTHGEETRTKEVPFGTQTIIDPNLQPGEVTIRQEGENGEIQQTYAVTYVDGVKESETLTEEKTTKIAIDKVIAVGPEKLRTIPTSPTNPTTAATATATAITAIPARRTTARTIRVRTTRISPIRISPIPTKPIRTSRIPRIRTIRTTTRITIPTTPRRTIRHRPHTNPCTAADSRTPAQTAAHAAAEQSFRRLPLVPSFRGTGTGLRFRRGGAARLDRPELDGSGQTLESRIRMELERGKRVFGRIRYSTSVAGQQNGHVRRELEGRCRRADRLGSELHRTAVRQPVRGVAALRTDRMVLMIRLIANDFRTGMNG